MLVIRFLRVGKKNQPSFKIVVTDKKNPPRGGRFVEQVGFYNPLTKEKNLKADRIKYWLSVGAKPSDTVHNLLVSEKIIKGKKKPVHKIKRVEEAKIEKKPVVPKEEEEKIKEVPKEEKPKEAKAPKKEKGETRTEAKKAEESAAAKDTESEEKTGELEVQIS